VLSSFNGTAVPPAFFTVKLALTDGAFASVSVTLRAPAGTVNIQ
jgi:hypothetical protein